MSTPFFDPWVPPTFQGILILAESCPKGTETTGLTGWRAHPDHEWPRKFVRRHVKEKLQQDDHTFSALRRSFLYQGRVLDSAEFWARHAFTNVIPRLMGGDTPARPTAQDAQDARTQLPLILNAVRPRGVLICSAWAVEVLQALSDARRYTKVGDDDWWEMRFGPVAAVAIYHPSAWNRRGYNCDRARLATAHLLRVAGGARDA